MEFYAKTMKQSKAVSKNVMFVCFLLLIISILVVFGSCLNNYFIGDDFPWITHSIKMKLDFFNALLERYTWLISSITFYLNLLLFGTNPAGFYLTNILIHAANVILLGIFTYYLTNNRFMSFLVMLLWGFNAQGVEAVFWLTGRAHSMLLLFILGALTGFIAWRKTKNTYLLVISIICSVLAHLTLFNAVIIPALILAYIYLFEKRRKKDYFYPVKTTAPYIIVTLTYLIFYLFIKTTLPASVYYKFDLSLLMNFGKYIFDYADFLYLNYRLDFSSTVIIIIGTVSTILFALFLFLTKDKVVKFGLLWIPITMAAYLPVPAVNYFQYSRYRYIPIAGFCIVLGSIITGLFEAPKKKKPGYLRLGINILAAIFIAIFLITNIYYVHLEQKGYKLFGNYHKLLADSLNINTPPSNFQKDKTIIFINYYNFNAPKYVNMQIKMPRPMFVRAYAPLGLIYIEDLINFCNYKENTDGIFTIDYSRNSLSTSISTGKYLGLQFTKNGFSYFVLNENNAGNIIEEWNKMPEFPPNISIINWKEKP